MECTLTGCKKKGSLFLVKKKNEIQYSLSQIYISQVPHPVTRSYYTMYFGLRYNFTSSTGWYLFLICDTKLCCCSTNFNKVYLNKVFCKNYIRTLKMAKQRSRWSEGRGKGRPKNRENGARDVFLIWRPKDPYFTRELPVRLGLVVFDNYLEYVTQIFSSFACLLMFTYFLQPV